MLAAQFVTDIFLRHLGQIIFGLTAVFLLAMINDRTGIDVAIGIKDAHHRLDRYGFARTGLTDDRDRLALKQVEPDTSDRSDRTEVGIERYIKISDRKYSFVFISFEFSHIYHLLIQHLRIEGITQAIGKQVET